MKTRLLYAAVAIVSLAAGLLTALWLDQRTSTSASASTMKDVGVPEHRVDFSLVDLAGNPQTLSNWDGKVVLLNFWATWCPPCRKEMPDFVEMTEELSGQGFEVIGVAIDRQEPVQDFIDEIGVEYPILLAELEGMQIMKSYGNKLLTLPYTVLIDRDGKVVKAFRTEVDKAMLMPMIEGLL